MNLLNRYSFSAVLFCLLLASCGQKSASDKLLDYAKEQGIEIQSDTKAIVILSNKGCVSCNKAMFELSQNYLNSKHVQYIVTANGGLLDIRSFLAAKNVSFDKKKIIHKTGLIEKSGVFFLNKKQKIDTLVNIEAKNIQQALAYIHKRIKSFEN